MAGTIPLSMTQQFDALGNVLAGGKLYLIQAGTVNTPQNGYQDSSLTLPWPNPIILDAAGRLPQFFLADGSIKVRLTDVNGVEQFANDGILVVGASSGGGGGSPVDATTVLATGDIKMRYGTGVLSGFVRANGRTMGSATSGATERANSDCQSLFEYLWATDVNLVVSTGRGASANADWVANKTIALPDMRGVSPAGMDDMGNSAAGRLTSTYFGNSTVLGTVGGGESKVLQVTEMPAHDHGGAITSPTIAINTFLGGTVAPSGSNTRIALTGAGGDQTANWATFQITPPSISGGISAQGGGIPHRVVGPRMVMTFYQKL